MKKNQALLRTFVSIAICTFTVLTTVEGSETKSKPKSISLKPSTATSESKTLNNSWYVMQSGNSPWGYFHEAIEKRDDKYIYRYEMVKRENGREYIENMGAIAKDDLTPIAFNLSKAGDAGTEIINGSYKPEAKSGLFSVEISGAKNTKLSRHVATGTIMEVFFPIYAAKKLPEMKPGATASLKVFTEDAGSAGYIAKSVQYKYVEKNLSDNCHVLDVKMDELKSVWCISDLGALQKMAISEHKILIQKVANEQEAKTFLAQEAPEKKPSKKKATNE